MIDVEKCKFTYYPAEVLALRAEPVGDINDSIRQLVKKMTDITIKKLGLGLAAPQVGISLRLFITVRARDKENVKVYINPCGVPIGEERNFIEEGCLSVPGIFTKIWRYKRLRILATDLDGNKFTEEVEGLEARVLQHEYDHIEGRTIIDRMERFAKLALSKQLKKLVEV